MVLGVYVGFRVQGFRVWGLGFGVSDLGFRVQGFKGVLTTVAGPRI